MYSRSVACTPHFCVRLVFIIESLLMECATWTAWATNHTLRKQISVTCQKAWPHGDLHSFIHFYCKYISAFYNLWQLIVINISPMRSLSVGVHNQYVQLHLRLYLCFDESVNIILKDYFPLRFSDDNKLKTNIIKIVLWIKVSPVCL